MTTTIRRVALTSPSRVSHATRCSWIQSETTLGRSFCLQARQDHATRSPLHIKAVPASIGLGRLINDATSRDNAVMGLANIWPDRGLHGHVLGQLPHD